MEYIFPVYHKIVAALIDLNLNLNRRRFYILTLSPFSADVNSIKFYYKLKKKKKLGEQFSLFFGNIRLS